MRTRVSRITLAGVSAFALALPLLPLMTTPAVAATGDPVRELRLADPEGDGSFAVYGTSATPLVGNTNTLDVEAFGQSTDGARFVAVETSHNSAGTATASRVVVHDVSGRAVRTMATLTAPNGVGFDRPELSPDGNRVAWERETYNVSTGVSASTSYEAAISGGAVRSLGDVQPEAYLDNQSVLVHHNGPGYTYSVDALDGSGGAVDLPTEVYSVSVSRDGTQLLYSWFTGSTIKLQLAAFDRASLAVTGVQTLDTDHDDIAAVFAPVDGQIDFCRYDSSAGDVHQHIWRMAATAGATASRLNPNDAADIDSITSGSYDAVKPASATAGAATLAGTSATVRWTLPAGTDVAGARISRTLSSGGAAKVVDVNAPAASYNDSGLTVGSTYAYTF